MGDGRPCTRDRSRKPRMLHTQKTMAVRATPRSARLGKQMVNGNGIEADEVS